MKGWQDASITARESPTSSGLEALVKSSIIKMKNKMERFSDLGNQITQTVDRNSPVWVPASLATKFVVDLRRLLWHVQVAIDCSTEASTGANQIPNDSFWASLSEFAWTSLPILFGAQVESVLASNNETEAQLEATAEEEHSSRFEETFQETLSDLRQHGAQRLINFTVLAQALAKKTQLAEFLRSSVNFLGPVNSFEGFRRNMHLMWTRLLVGATIPSRTSLEGLDEQFSSTLSSFLKTDALYKDAFAGRVCMLVKRSCLMLFMLLESEDFHRIVHSVQLELAHEKNGRRRSNARLASGEKRTRFRRRKGALGQEKTQKR